jgi:hypothetical protein
MLLGLAILGGCDARSSRHSRGSVTVQLPAARPAASEPGFSFSNSGEAERQGAVARH